MTGLDTNVIVRFLMKDDAEQAALANTIFAGLMAETPGFVCREVLVELVWVLQRVYRLSRTDIADAIEGLLGAREIVVESADQPLAALVRRADPIREPQRQPVRPDAVARPPTQGRRLFQRQPLHRARPRAAQPLGQPPRIEGQL